MTLARRRLLLVTPALLAAGTARAVGAADTEALAAQRQAMQALAMLDGVWRGPATAYQPGGGTIEMTQTERAGNMLGGTIKVVEGRGHHADGSVGFNAFAVIAYSPQTRRYTMRSWAQGRSGEFAVEPRPDGFVWFVPAGPGATVRFTATVKNGVWHEVGEYLAEGKPPVKTMEMRLQRLGDTRWPEEGAVPAR